MTSSRRCFESPPEAEQKAVRREAEEDLASRNVKAPDYFCNYFDGQ